MMLGLPPEVEYHHVLEGALTLGALVGLLLVVFAAHRGHLTTAASALASALVLAGLGLAISRTYRRYRHAGAGILVLAALLGLLGGAVYNRAHLLTLAPAAADSVASH
jgi:hypothetical protein